MPSVLTTTLFVALVSIVSVVIARSLRHASAGLALVTVFGLAYLVVPAVLAGSGALDRYAPLPAPALVMVFILTVMTLSFAFSNAGARLATGVSLAGLVGFHVFRLPLEWLLHRLFEEGVVPVQMTYAGRNWDILTGLTAALLAGWIAGARKVPRGAIVTWNLLGLALLVNIVTVAILSTPVPFRQFMTGPPNVLPSMFPYVWLPTLLVQAALAGHVLLFRRLRMKDQ